MREEYISVLSTPIEADNIGRFGRYRYIGKTQISADISVDLYKWLCKNLKALRAVTLELWNWFQQWVNSNLTRKIMII